jgi:hypothetical protein
MRKLQSRSTESDQETDEYVTLPLSGAVSQQPNEPLYVPEQPTVENEENVRRYPVRNNAGKPPDR